MVSFLTVNAVMMTAIASIVKAFKLSVHLFEISENKCGQQYTNKISNVYNLHRVVLYTICTVYSYYYYIYYRSIFNE